MKSLLLSLTLFLFSNIAAAGWWEDTKEKASSAMDSVSEATSDAYEGTKDFVNENKDGWIDSGKELYENSKNMISGDDEENKDDKKK